jgi:thiol-disulfide isomerase/thioredoxin
MGPSPSRHRAGPTLAAVEAATDLDGVVIGPLDPAQIGTVAMVFASWCEHCRDELPVLTAFRDRHPTVRVLGINYRGHEEYDGRGDAAAVRRFVVELAPWLRVVPADERVWASLGRPPKVPTVYVFDRAGVLVRAFDRRAEPPPSLDALEAAVPGLR